MHPYSAYAGNAAPVGWALQQSGYSVLSEVVTAIALAGMFIALLGMVLAGSRLLYAFGRDGLLPKGLGKMNARNLPANGVWTLAIVAIVIRAFFPAAFLAQLISAGTLIAFMFVTLGIYSLSSSSRKRFARSNLQNAFLSSFTSSWFYWFIICILGIGCASKTLFQEFGSLLEF